MLKITPPPNVHQSKKKCKFALTIGDLGKPL